MGPYVFLYSIAALLFLGLTGFLLSHRWRLPHSLILILLGAIVVRPAVSLGIIAIPLSAVETFVRIALILVVFDIFSRYDHRAPTSIHGGVRSFKLLAVTIGIPFLAAASHFIIGLDSYAYALLFAALILPSSRVFVKKFRPLKAKTAQITEIESIKVTAYALIITASLLFIIGWEGPGLFKGVVWGFLAGCGTGIFCGLLFARALHHPLLERVRILSLLSSIFVTYALAEALGGIAIVSIMSLAFFFGSLKTKKMPFLYGFSSNVAEFSEMAVFLLLGALMPLPSSPWIVGASLIVFLLTVLTRYVIYSSTINGSAKERLFLACLTPKDISTAVIAILLLTGYGLGQDSSLVQSLALIIFYSITVSWIAIMLEKREFGKVSSMSSSDL